jgi:hypothetical protein
MGFNRRKMEDQRRQVAEKEAAAVAHNETSGLFLDGLGRRLRRCALGI